MTQPSGSARVLSVIQELRQLRDKVCILSEKNRALAKALCVASPFRCSLWQTGVKQELTKARAAQTAMFSDKVQHRSIQCNIKELDQDTCATVGANLEPEPEPEPSYSPCWSARAIRLSQSTPRVSVSAVSYNRAPAIFACTKVIDRAIEENASTVESGDEDMTKAVAMTDSTTNNRQYAYVRVSFDDRLTATELTRVKRQLRQRDTNMSYAEPKLNTKLRRLTLSTGRLLWLRQSSDSPIAEALRNFWISRREVGDRTSTLRSMQPIQKKTHYQDSQACLVRGAQTQHEAPAGTCFKPHIPGRLTLI
ncbi:hypothetical protein P3T76_003192 [Phytophthora citrophthora]|uniref:Shugoshin C-terminal domain-containing protein n=1 Tax=Phytophthora citrophthora TaxID=4793 RepID=A0AAD9GWZ9_9STRA|nr:hypothetical protein P3T76_003192 [Phytophthora citrophthora]